MIVSIAAIRAVLNGVETNLKEALYETVVGIGSYELHNKLHIRTALEDVQDAITELLLVK